MIKYFIIQLLIISSIHSYCQSNIGALPQEDPAIKELQHLGQLMIESEFYNDRQDANYSFIKKLTQYLNQENTFEKTLDSLGFISVQTPNDSLFRIITWQVQTSPGLVRHYGAIQMNTPTLQLIPLVDRSDDIKNPEQYVGDNNHWYGAIYYDIQALNTEKGRAYLLYGYDANTPYSNRKLLDILYLSRNGKKLVFGAPIFPNYKKPVERATRFIVEYREDAATTLHFDPERKQVIFDHLVPMNGEVDEGIYTNYVPDGTFDGLGFDGAHFIWEENALVITPRIFSPEDMENSKKSNTLYQSNSKN